MIPVASGVRVWIATGHTDMRRGMNSLALLVQEALKRDPHGGDLYDARFGARMSGQGEFAEQIARMFAVFARRHRLDDAGRELDGSRFRRPIPSSGQGLLFPEY